jgi:hypothetical protein
MPKRGVLYVVVGDDSYSEAAARSARSLRHAMPEIPIAVATDRGRTMRTGVDHCIPINEVDGYRAKILGVQRTPFEQTVMLDVDTYILGDVSELFELLNRFDMALAHAPVGVSFPLDDVPAAFPEFNTGVIAYRRTGLVDTVLADWLHEYDALSPLKPSTMDQPSFRRVAYRTSELRIATLAPEYNQRFMVAGFVNQPARILHGWPDRWAGESDYRKIADAIKTPLEAGDPCAVFAGRRVYNQHGKQVADFAVPWSRLRSLARPVVKRVRRLVKPGSSGTLPRHESERAQIADDRDSHQPSTLS